MRECCLGKYAPVISKRKSIPRNKKKVVFVNRLFFDNEYYKVKANIRSKKDRFGAIPDKG
jgi:hypothetical protein